MVEIKLSSLGYENIERHVTTSIDKVEVIIQDLVELKSEDQLNDHEKILKDLVRECETKHRLWNAHQVGDWITCLDPSWDGFGKKIANGLQMSEKPRDGYLSQMNELFLGVLYAY